MLGPKQEKKREQAAMEGQKSNWRMEIDALGLQGDKSERNQPTESLFDVQIHLAVRPSSSYHDKSVTVSILYLIDLLCGLGADQTKHCNEVC